MKGIEVYNPEKHTEEYGIWYNKVLEADKEFDKNPCKKTATFLADLKNKTVGYSRMYKEPVGQSYFEAELAWLETQLSNFGFK
jgi:hypothetical protein